MIRIITDGACQGNPGPGGWAAIIQWEDRPVEELSGSDPNTTNNRMELRAAIEGLKRLPSDVEVEIITDSQYLLKGMTEWLAGWKRRGWRTSSGGSVENRDLWEELERLAGRRVSWRWVKGHAGDPLNERADQIAQALARGKEVPKAYLSEAVQRAVCYKSSPSGIYNRPSGDSYLSLVGGVLARHRTWVECEARCKGVSGARNKKCKTLEDEINVIKSWGLTEDALSSLTENTGKESSSPAIKTEELNVIIFSLPYLPVTRKRLTEAGFQEEKITHSSATFRLRYGQAILEAYTSGKVVPQGVWDERSRSIWLSVIQAEMEWLYAAVIDQISKMAIPKPNWSEQEWTFLQNLLARDLLPGWRGELAGRYLTILREPGSIPAGVLGKAGWRKEPDDEINQALWEAYWQSRLRPDRWCAAQVQNSTELALALFPLTVPARRWADSWDWEAVKNSLPGDQAKITKLLHDQLPGIVVQKWPSSTWKAEAKRLGNQLDFIFQWLCTHIVNGASQLDWSETWPLELIKVPTGNEDWSHRLVEQRTEERVSYRPPILDEEYRGVEMASFLASYHLSME
jgi:ribonuclease HI